MRTTPQDQDARLPGTPPVVDPGIAPTDEPTADGAGPSRWTPPATGSRRRSIVPRWVPIAAGAAIVLLVVAIGLAIWSASLAVVRVPALRGMDRATAAARLQEVGLVLRTGDRRFSDTVPAGQVVDQSPVPGSKVSEGAEVLVAISAGTEDFPMPDVTGMPVDQARKTLRDRGLSVDVVTAASDKTKGTVIETFPSPGVTVAAGDSVRLSVAAGSGTGGALLPTDLTGKTFTLDPAPMPAPGVADTTMDVARRLRALLEASGAKVIVTRDVTDSGEAVSTAARARKAKEASATALIGFSVVLSGQGGLAVFSLPATGATQPFYLNSASMASALVEALKGTGRGVTTSPATSDTILTGSGLPASRLRLGSLGTPDDKLLFTDPQWADDVARAVYRAIGTVYGSK